MKKLFTKIKSMGFMGLLPWFWLVLAYFWQMLFQIRHGVEILDSDLAAEMVLSNLLNKEKVILSKNWFYSTELRVFESQWFYRIGLLISPNNWHVARVIATMIMIALFIVLVILTARALNLEKYAPWIAAILTCPFGRFWLVFSLYGTYYLIYAGFSLMTVIAVMGLVKSEKVFKGKNVPYVILGAFAAFASGLNGIKQFIFFFAPLILSTFILLIFSVYEKGESIKREKDILSVCQKEIRLLCATVFFSVINIAGHFVNSKILIKYYTFTDFGTTNWSVEPEKRLYDLLIDFISLFGYEKGDKVLSVRGILAGIGLLFGFMVLGSVVFLIMNFRKLKMTERLITLINAVTICLCLLIFCFIELYQNYHWLYHEYYWLPLMPFLICSVMITVRILSERMSFKPKIIGTVLSVIAIVAVTAVSKNTTDHEVNRPLVAFKGYPEAARYLMDNNLNEGYGMFWSCAVLREVSSGKIETWNVTNPDTYALHEWLQEKEHLQRDPEGKVFFILDSDLIGETYDQSAMIQGDNCTEVYVKDNIHIYTFENAESFKTSGWNQ